MPFAASFDIGKCNFAFYIEEYDVEALSSLENIQKQDRYNPDGTPTETFQSLLSKIQTNGKLILYKNNNLTVGTDKSKYLDKQIYSNMIKVLDEYKAQFDLCSIIIIEQQMSFKAAQNTMALKLGQHCFSYFLFRYPEGEKEIIEFPAYYKTQILGAPKVMPKATDNGKAKGKAKAKAMTKPERKKWSVQQALKIFTEREDSNALEELKKSKKKDDLADVVIQLQSFKFLRYIDKSL